MEKRINIIMNPNKDIVISINNETKLTIEKNSRTITADSLYHILDYSRGDTYIVEKSNEQDVDKPVLEFFADLLSDICQRINSLSTESQEESSLGQCIEQDNQQLTDGSSCADNTCLPEIDELPF